LRVVVKHGSLELGIVGVVDRTICTIYLLQSLECQISSHIELIELKDHLKLLVEAGC
jgi:hypothetical protein